MTPIVISHMGVFTRRNDGWIRLPVGTVHWGGWWLGPPAYIYIWVDTRHICNPHIRSSDLQTAILGAAVFFAWVTVVFAVTFATAGLAPDTGAVAAAAADGGVEEEEERVEADADTEVVAVEDFPADVVV